MVGKRKRKLKFSLHNWQLILILVPLAFVAATLLRLDHIRMTDLRDAVMAADEAEDDEAIAAALTELKDFTFSHIVVNIVEENGLQKVEFGTGPFYLEKQYLRHAHKALEEAQAKFVDTGNPNGNVYGKASAVCQPQAIRYGWRWNSPAYINCMTTEINKYPVEERLETSMLADIPSTELFRHNYNSPVWTPSVAGWVIVLCVIILVIIIVRILIWVVLEISLFFVKKV